MEPVLPQELDYHGRRNLGSSRVYSSCPSTAIYGHDELWQLDINDDRSNRRANRAGIIVAGVKEIRNAHPVMKLIAERALTWSQPFHRQDRFKLGLVVEGGAMRGIISAGMLAGLESLGLLRVFDAVYGASAGAFNGAYFLAGQASDGVAIYYENLNSKKFINLWRIFRGKPVVSLAYVLEKVLIQEKPLHWQAVLESPIPLKIAASSLGHLKTRVLQGFTNREELFTALRASSEMPLLAGGPVEFQGDRFLDAGLFQGIPIYAALEDDCSHLLVLLTRPRGAQRKSPNFWDRQVGARIMERWKKGLGSAYLKMPKMYNETLSFLEGMQKSLKRRPYVFSISLSRDYPLIERLERDPVRLRKAADDGRLAVCLALGGESPE